MSRNLEKEYKELMTEAAPDLWDRIEAGLEPKQPSSKKANPWRRYHVWGTAVAACVCLAVIIPAAFGIFTEKSERLSGNSAGGSQSPAQSAGKAYENGGPQESAAMDYNGTSQGSSLAAESADSTFLEGEASSGNDFMPCTVRATLMEISDAEDGTVYTVQVEETDYWALSEGDIVDLYGEGVTEELAVGEKYLFELSVSTDDYGEIEYRIIDIW